MSLFSKIFGNGGPDNIDEYVEDMNERSSEFDSENDYLDSLKQDDSYHFSIPFTYYLDPDDDDEEGETGYMEVDVDWDYYDHGYGISYHFAEDYDMDTGLNGDENEIYETQIESLVTQELVSRGIPIEAIKS